MWKWNHSFWRWWRGRANGEKRYCDYEIRDGFRNAIPEFL